MKNKFPRPNLFRVLAYLVILCVMAVMLGGDGDCERRESTDEERWERDAERESCRGNRC